MANHTRILPSPRAIASLLLASALTGCSGMFTTYESPQAQGARLYQEKNYTESAGAYRNAVRKDPRDYRSHYYLAVACDADHRYQEAVESYRSALDIMNVTYDGRADIAFRLKVLNGLAITVAKSDPHDTQINAIESQARTSRKAEDLFLLAKIYRYRHDPDKALENYQFAALVDNQNFPVLKEYGLYLQEVKLTQRAAATLSQAYRVYDQDEQVNAALRSMGIVPGPSLKERADLAQPLVPKGPIPPVDWSKVKNSIGLGGGGNANDAGPAVSSQPPAPASSLQAPRD